MSMRGSRGFDLLQGEPIMLAASAARTATAGTNGTAYVTNGERSACAVLLEFTDKKTAAGDTCDVYIDFYVPQGDGGAWINAVHFTQALGNGTDAEKQYVLLTPAAGTTAPTVVTGDASAGAARPEVTGSQIRARWVIVSGTDASFTFSVYAYGLSAVTV